MSLNADRQRRLLAVFEKTMLREPLAREAYVDRACGDDSELRSDVMRLLALDEEVGSFFEHPTNLLRSAPADEEHFPGTDRFRVLRRLGRGRGRAAGSGLASGCLDIHLTPLAVLLLLTSHTTAFRLL